MQSAGAPLTRNDAVGLLTCPVGPCGPALVVGIVTSSGRFVAVTPLTA